MSEHNPSFAKAASSTEAMFNVDEVFYSRTDKRGVILAGNDVFQRVAGHDWDTLIGAPHKIIRHPDMPRGVFELMWQRIKDGRATGAYVKNRRICGRYYWVFALVAPGPDGYISIRIKPTSPLRAEIETLYSDLAQRESEDGLTPADSAEALQMALRDRGYTTYDAFQSHAFASEFEARARLTGTPMDPLLKRYLDMSRAIAQVEDETAKMTEAFQAIRTVPMNMRIIASRLENAGGPISAISVNYSQMLEDMSTWVKTFVDGEDCVFARIRDAILTGQFLTFSSAVERQMIEAFSTSKQEACAAVDIAHETTVVHGHEQEFARKSAEMLNVVEREARRFAHSVQDMKRYVTGLSSTRMMCKIENASLNDSGTALNGIVEQLDICQAEIEDRLAKVMDLNSVVQNNIALLRAMR